MIHSKTRETRVRSLLGCSALLAATLVAPSVHAQGADQKAMAEVLFQEGQSLMAEKQFERACRKLEDSLSLDRAGGTLMMLAYCHEAEGRTASAWSEFIEAAALARRDGRSDRETAAIERSKALQPTLSKLTVALDPSVASMEGIEVLRDGTPVPRQLWATPVPVDPGKHLVLVRATAKVERSFELEILPNGDAKTVVVDALDPVVEKKPVAPPLAASSPSVPSPSAPPPQSSSGEPTNTGGWILTGAGGLILGTGLFFGTKALDKMDEADSYCPQTACSDERGLQASEDAERWATMSNIGVVLGAAGLGLGVYMLLSPSNPQSHAPASGSPTLHVVPSARGFSLQGDF